jgi:hypothetical protein
MAPSFYGEETDMKIYCLAMSFLLSLLVTSVYAADVGSVKSVEGEAWIVRGTEQIPAQKGMRLQVSDRLKTGPNGAMGLFLRDDTIISMGSAGEMVLVEFVFQPRTNELGMLTRFLKGSFTYISGIMARLNPESVKIETPVSMVSIRGTHFLVNVKG